MLISVDKAIKDLRTLNGKNVEIFGILHLDFEGMCIDNISDKKEPKDNSTPSIWTNYEIMEYKGMATEYLKKYNNKKVVISGILRGPQPECSGCGQYSLWPAEIEVMKIYLIRNRRQIKE